MLVEGIVNLYSWGRADPAGRAGHTKDHAIRATPVTSAQVWKAWARATWYWAAVAAEVEEVVDPVVSGEETLGVPG